MVDIADINTLFQMIDSDENGYIDKEKLQQLCPHLSPREIDTIFHHLLQSNKQTTIDYQLNTQENMTQTQIKEVFNNLAWYVTKCFLVLSKFLINIYIYTVT
jgi:Ca2+-binding EF-hand superfamily protein